MAQGNRAARVGEEIRQELSRALAVDVHDPGIGFITLTRVTLSPDLQVARVYYTIIGDDKARRETKKALERASPFLRRHVAAAVRLRRVPELHFHFDESVEKHDRIEQILLDLQREREEREAAQQPDALDLKVKDSERSDAQASESSGARSPGPSGPGSNDKDHS